MSARILVVEDEEALTTLLRYNLDAEGYDVETVGRGDDADTRLKERVPDKMSGAVDVEDADNPSGFELPGADLSDLELDVVVLPPQEDEFTCIECFLVKHRTQIDHETTAGAVCIECA